jgi:hypothetical protein
LTTLTGAYRSAGVATATVRGAETRSVSQRVIQALYRLVGVEGAFA